ncbi:MAG: hypothetical protein ACREJB_12410, partial [Planctomycetaceae bacterium]
MFVLTKTLTLATITPRGWQVWLVLCVAAAVLPPFVLIWRHYGSDVSWKFITFLIVASMAAAVLAADDLQHFT